MPLVPSQVLEPVRQCLPDFIEAVNRNEMEVFLRPWTSPTPTSLQK